MSLLDVRRASGLVAAVALVVGVAMRINNAVQYEMLWGFDALYNWHYIERLTQSWQLPAPDAGWSTAHPPLFYYIGGAIARLLADWDRDSKVIVLRLAVSGAGLIIVALSVALVRKSDPQNPRRALLAGGLILFLPVHIYMSAMLTEEIVAAMWISLALAIAGARLASPQPEFTARHAVAVGIVAGAAFLTKLTGVLVIGSVALAFFVDAWRRDAIRESLFPIAVLVSVAGVLGGWYYVRNLIEYGYLYPHGLETHKIMFTMPPGRAAFVDYLRFPLVTFTDPQVLNPGLLRSIWGSTYLTMWFDGHRVFLPTDTPRVSHVGTLITTLALVPMCAYATGLLRGIRRVLRGERGLDVLLLSMVGISLAGYVLFTWKNPWFVTRKAGFLLGLSVPFAYYTSEVLDDWTQRGAWTRRAVWSVLAVLSVAIAITFFYSDALWNIRHMEKPGVVW